MPATGTCTVTPAIVFTETTNVTHAELNQAANPQVQIPDGAIGTRHLDPADVKTGLGVVGDNYFLNPNFSAVKWTRGTTAVSCPIATQTYRADDWWVTPAVAAVTYERVQSGPNALSLHSAQITGAASVTTVDFGQDIASHIATALAAPIVVSLYLYNNTGASLTPTLRIDTCPSLDDFAGIVTATHNRYSTASSTPQATAQWTLHTWVLDATAFAGMANGARVYVRLPNGSMTAGKSVRFAQAKIEIGTSRTAFVVPLEEAATEDETATTASTDTVNLLANPNFIAPTWRTSSAITLASAVDVWGVQSWWVNAGGVNSNGRLQRSTAVPNICALHSLQVTGGGDVTAVKIGQDVPSYLAACARREMVFACEFYNGTGAAIQPVLKMATCNAADVFTVGAITEVRSQTLASCPDAQWTRLTDAFDATAYSNLANGFRIWIEIPDTIMPTTGDVVRVSEASLTPGLTPPDFEADEPGPLETSINGQAAGLVIAWASVSTLTVAADEIILKDDAGSAIRVVNLSGTVNIGNNNVVNGRDGFTEASDAWYYIWAISNGVTAGGLLSESASSPTLPSGYRYKALIGFVRNTTNDFVRFKQMGKVYVRTPVEAITSIDDEPKTFTLTDYIPPIVARFSGFWATTANVNLAVKMYSDSSMLDAHYFMAIASGIGALDTYRTAIPFDVPINAPPTLYVNAPIVVPPTPFTDYTMAVTGYTLK